MRAFCDGPKVVLKARHPSSTLARPVKPKKILVVDDSDLMQRMYGVMLRGGGLVAARDGDEALARIAADPEIDLVLLDINMPKMNGIEFLREVRRDPVLRSLCVVVLTTSNEDRDRIEAYQLNVAGYLLKPVTFIHFVDVMATLNKYWALMEMP